MEPTHGAAREQTGVQLHRRVPGAANLTRKRLLVEISGAVLQLVSQAHHRNQPATGANLQQTVGVERLAGRTIGVKHQLCLAEAGTNRLQKPINQPGEKETTGHKMLNPLHHKRCPMRSRNLVLVHRQRRSVAADKPGL